MPRLSRDFQDARAWPRARHVLIKAERFNRTLQEGWAYRQEFTSNPARADALKPWPDSYNHHWPHAGLSG